MIAFRLMMHTNSIKNIEILLNLVTKEASDVATY
jgi:hypothetical protein